MDKSISRLHRRCSKDRSRASAASSIASALFSLASATSYRSTSSTSRRPRRSTSFAEAFACAASVAATCSIFLRVAPMCIADWLREYLGTSAEGDLAAAALALPALQATFSAPRSPGGCANLLLLEAMRGPGSAGGGHQFVSALERAAKDVRVEIRTGARVAAIDVERGTARGVTLVNGERIGAAVVAASCDPRTTLLGTHSSQARQCSPVRAGHQLPKPRHNGPSPGRRLKEARAPAARGHRRRARRHRESPSNPIKYRQLPKRPVLELSVVSVEDPSLCPDRARGPIGLGSLRSVRWWI